MSVVVTAIADKTVVAGTRTRLRLAFRGKRRHAIKQLLHYAQLVGEQDLRDVIRAATIGYNPVTFQIANNNPVALSLTQILRRCSECLEMRG